MGLYIGQEPLGQVITGSEIPDGLITPDKVATGFFQRKNAIINGDFNIWQRGTSFASIASAQYSADRWGYVKVGSMVHDLLRSTDVPTIGQSGRLFNYSLLVDCATADSSIAAGDVCAIYHRIEGYNWLPLAQRPITLSFWVKATKAGTYCVALRNNDGATPDRCYVGEYSINQSDTWERKTVTVSASPSSGTWDYTTGVGLGVWFVLACGSTYQTTPSVWQTGDFAATANQVNACDSSSNNFRITGVQLEAGNVATDFEYRAFQDELMLCQRYYEIYNDALYTMNGTAQSAGAVGHTVDFRVTKRTTPTLTLSSTNVLNIGGGPNADLASANGFRLTGTAGGAGAWHMQAFWSANAEL